MEKKIIELTQDEINHIITCLNICNNQIKAFTTPMLSHEIDHEYFRNQLVGKMIKLTNPDNRPVKINLKKG